MTLHEDMPTWREASTLSVAIARRLPQFTLDVRFCVPAGRTVLFGPSGAGKSLTLQSLAGLFPLDRASISNGPTVWHESATGIFVPPQQRRVGYLPQQYALFPHLTVAQNIAFGQRQRGPQAKRRVGELLALMQLEGLEGRRPAQLSGGQQQRVALARALASEPQLLLLDEPWSALDAPVRASLREEMQRFYEQVGVPLVLVTHDIQDAQALADTIVVISRGRVLQSGSPEEVFRRPSTPQVAELVGMRTRWSGVIQELGPSSARGRLATIEVGALSLHAWVAAESTLRAGQTVEIGLKADEISLSLPDIERSVSMDATSTCVLGTVARDQGLGAFSTVTVQLAGQFELDVPVPRWQHRALRLDIGMPLTLTIPCEALHLFEPEADGVESLSARGLTSTHMIGDT